MLKTVLPFSITLMIGALPGGAREDGEDWQVIDE
jgi:hypothetical protein